MAETEKKRGVWLTILLVIMLIASLFVTLFYLLFNKVMVDTFPDVAIWIWYVYGLIGLLNSIFIGLLFMWKRWPFYGICAITIISIIMNLSIGLGIFKSIVGLVGIIILYFSMRSRWNLFD